MNISSLLKPATLKFLGVIVVAIGLKSANQSLTLGALCLLSAGLVWDWLHATPTTTPSNLELPDSCVRNLSNSLHHSQIPLLEQVIQPILAGEFVELKSQVVGKTLAGHSISLFDKKINELIQVFSDLKASRVLYQKRAFEERDRAVTLLVFLALFYKEQEQEGQLADVLKKIPVQAYKLLRKEAYRLFDLSYLLIEHKVVVNHDLIDELSKLSLFNQYKPDLKSMAQPPIISNVSIPDSTTKPVLVEEDPSLSVENTIQKEKSALAPSEQEELAQEVSTACEQSKSQTEQVNKPASIEAQKPLIVGFVNWLEKRINSGNRQFALESQKLVISNPEKYGNLQVFILPEVLGKYQSRSGVDSGKLKQELIDKSELKLSFSIDKEGAQLEIIPCLLESPFECKKSTPIIEGDLS